VTGGEHDGCQKRLR